MSEKDKLLREYEELASKYRFATTNKEKDAILERQLQIIDRLAELK